MAERTCASLWEAVELFAAKQRKPRAPDYYLEPPDCDHHHLKELVPCGASQGLLTAMAAFAYFGRGDGFRGRWMLTGLSHGAIRVAENAVVALQTTQNLMRRAMTLAPLNEHEATKATWAILMGENAK